MSNEGLIKAVINESFIIYPKTNNAQAELLRRLEEGEKAQESIEILCYISLDGGIISRGKACEFMGIDRAELDEKLGEIQLGIAKRNIDLVDFYQSSKA